VTVVTVPEQKVVTSFVTSSTSVDLPALNRGKTYTVYIYSMSNNVLSKPPTSVLIAVRGKPLGKILTLNTFFSL